MPVDLSNYNTVPERLAEFFEKHPEGSLQQIDLQFVQVGDSQFVVYTAAAYRFPEDPRPGHGTAWEPIPGLSNFTRNSEVQNAETSAWGRAIIAVGAADASKIASREEVRNRDAEKKPMAELIRLLSGSGLPKAEQQHLVEIAVGRVVYDLKVLTEEEIVTALESVRNALGGNDA